MPEASLLITFFILILIELVLGFDNVLMISIISQRVKEKNQKVIRYLGLVLAALNRVLIILTITWFTALEKVLFYIGDLDIVVKDIIFFFGGFFLVFKSVKEIYIIIEHKNEDISNLNICKKISMLMAVLQIVAIDAVFSIDSVITAIGLTDNLLIIISSVFLSVVFMLVFVNKISDFIKNNISIKILALSFIFIIGIALCLEVFDKKVPKYYLGTTLVFALLIQLLQLRYKGNKKRKKKRIFIRSLNKKTL